MGLTFTGSESKRIQKNLAANLTFGYASFTQGFSAGLSFTGGLSGSPVLMVALTAVLSFTGSLAKRLARALTGVLSSAGSFVVTKTAQLMVFASGLSFGGGVATSLISAGTFFESFTAAMAFVGHTTRMTDGSLAAVLSFAGQTRRTTGRLMTASLSVAGTIGRAVAHGLLSALPFAGVLTTGSQGAFTLSFGAGLGLTGQVARATAHRLASSSLGLAGSFGRLFPAALTGSLSLIGQFRRSTSIPFSAVLSTTGSTARALTRLLRGVAGLSGLMAPVYINSRLFVVDLSAALSFTGQSIATLGDLILYIVTTVAQIWRRNNQGLVEIEQDQYQTLDRSD